MQENYNKKTIFFERLSQIFDYYGIKNVKSFACDYLGYKSPEKINRLKDNNNKPSYDILFDISNKFEDINIQWLITGRGEMLKPHVKTNLQEPSQPDDPIVSYLERTIKEKDERIEKQAQEIGRLREINENLEEDNQKLRQVIVQLRNAEDASDVVAAS